VPQVEGLAQGWPRLRRSPGTPSSALKPTAPSRRRTPSATRRASPGPFRSMELHRSHAQAPARTWLAARCLGDRRGGWPWAGSSGRRSPRRPRETSARMLSRQPRYRDRRRVERPRDADGTEQAYRPPREAHLLLLRGHGAAAVYAIGVATAMESGHTGARPTRCATPSGAVPTLAGARRETKPQNGPGRWPTWCWSATMAPPCSRAPRRFVSERFSGAARRGPSRPTASSIWRSLPRSRQGTCQIPRSSSEPCMKGVTASDVSEASVMPTGMKQNRPSSGDHRHGWRRRV
jgi:hypothetical protein